MTSRPAASRLALPPIPTDPAEMPFTVANVQTWCQHLLGPSSNIPPLEDCLDVIPDLESLSDLPAGTRVLVRGDTDVIVGEGDIITNDVRLQSLLETLRFGIERDWVPIVYGHRGRDPQLSLEPVARHLEALLSDAKGEGQRVTFLGDWLDNGTGEVLPSVAQQLNELPNGTVAVLENTRRYSLEQALWKADSSDIEQLGPRLTAYVNSVSERLARVHINEGFAASNRDLSSTLVPLSCDRIALGRYVGQELGRFVTRTRRAQLVIFSGIKINKLDDLEQILGRENLRMVIAAGGIALALKKAEAILDGSDFCLGLAGDPEQTKIFIPPERIEQATAILQRGLAHGVEFVLPVDFLLGDGTAAREIPQGEAQFDVGPETIQVQADAVGRFLEFHRSQLDSGKTPAIAFHNGVFGLFEEAAFETGTRAFIGELKRMTEAGVEVYVGGGEGGTALVRYGEPDWVTHCFTAGGTILKALGNEPIPYLKALYLRSLALADTG